MPPCLTAQELVREHNERSKRVCACVGSPNL